MQCRFCSFSLSLFSFNRERYIRKDLEKRHVEDAACSVGNAWQSVGNAQQSVGAVRSSFNDLSNAAPHIHGFFVRCPITFLLHGRDGSGLRLSSKRWKNRGCVLCCGVRGGNIRRSGCRRARIPRSRGARSRPCGSPWARDRRPSCARSRAACCRPSPSPARRRPPYRA